MSMCESILTIALVCTVKYLHYCDYYYTLGNDSQSTPKLIAYIKSATLSELETISISYMCDMQEIGEEYLKGLKEFNESKISYLQKR